MALIPRAVRNVTRQTVPSERRYSSGASLSTIGGGLTNSGGAASFSTDKAFSEMYYANVFVYACARAIAQDLAARPVRVGADPANPRDFNAKHPLAIRLGPAPGGPNPEMSSTQLRRWSTAQKVITGSFAWEIDPATLDFWPLLIRLLKPIPTEGRPGERSLFKAFEYGTGRDKRVIPADRVFYDFVPSQTDWRTPESALQAARLDVSVMVMQDRYDNAFIKNDNRPAAIVVHEAFTDDDKERAFRRGFTDSHRGPDNAGKTHFVATSANGASVKDALSITSIGLSQRDSEALKRYDAKIRACCIALGVPLSRLGDASGSTFNNSDVETLNYWRDTIKPTGDDQMDMVNHHLMPLFDNSGNVAFLDYTGVPDLEPIKRFAVGDIPTLVSAQIISPNEGRVEIGLPESDDPDMDKIGGAVPAPPAIPAAAPPPAPALAAADIAKAVHAAVAPLSAALADVQADIARQTVRDVTGTGDRLERDIRRTAERRAHHWRQVDRASARLEKSWKRAFEQLFDDQAASILKRLEGKRGRQAVTRAGDDPIDPDSVFDAPYWEERTRVVSTALYESTVESALTQVDAAFDIAFDIDNPAAVKFIETRASKLAGQITATTRDAIKDQLAAGAKGGEGIPDLASRIKDLFTQTYRHRAETVARTEVISAYNGSARLAIDAQDADTVGGMEWISTADDRTRDAHADADGTIIGVGESFSIDGEDLEYPGDPNGSPDNIINCRCTIAPVTPADMPTREAKHVHRASVERAAIRMARGELDLESALRALTNA